MKRLGSILLVAGCLSGTLQPYAQEYPAGPLYDTPDELSFKARAAARKRERDRKAQEAALAALEDREHVRRTVENNKEGMRFYEQAFREMGLEWIPSQGNFILVKVGRGKQVFQDMLARGVIVRAQDGYGLPEWIRISVGTPAENARCIEVLKEVL